MTLAGPSGIFQKPDASDNEPALQDPCILGPTVRTINN